MFLLVKVFNWNNALNLNYTRARARTLYLSILSFKKKKKKKCNFCSIRENMHYIGFDNMRVK